jgi:hypothetical protein
LRDEVKAMKHPLSPAVRLSFALLVVCLPFAARAKAQTSTTEAGRQAVVVELFTSEGCSTCPPADTLLQQLEQRQPVAGAEIIALEEHVDYWNHEGWNDPFSSSEWTLRQQDYAAVFKNDVYTPEFVVNGHQFAGSDSRKAEFEIQKAAHGAQAEVAITSGSPQGKGAQHFTVSVGKLAQSLAGGDRGWPAFVRESWRECRARFASRRYAAFATEDRRRQYERSVGLVHRRSGCEVQVSLGP